MDNLHTSHSAVDGGAGRKLRARRDASPSGIGNNFSGHELGVPAYIVELTNAAIKQEETERRYTSFKRESELPARPPIRSFSF